MSICEIKILGCGGSGGVPLATNFWGDCNPNNPKNRRTRSSIAISTKTTTIVIDTGPDFHYQTLNNNIDNIDAIIYTHDHADHVNGIDDVRYLAIKKRIFGDQDYMVPIYADKQTLDSLKTRFGYMFRTSDDGLYVPLIKPNIIKTNDKVVIKDIELQSFVQTHGKGKSLGFIIGDVAYSTDVSDLSHATLNKLNGIKTWIIDCGQFNSDFTTVHPNYNKVLEWNKIVCADKLYLTHLTPRDDYTVINNSTPNHIEAAYDGLIINTKVIST